MKKLLTILLLLYAIPAFAGGVTMQGVTVEGAESITAPYQQHMTDGIIPDQCASGDCSLGVTRASIANITDHMGVVRAVQSGETRHQGSRRVENLLAAESSDDWSVGDWTKSGTATVTGTNQLNFAAAGDSIYQSVPMISGETYALSVTLNLPSGTDTTVIRWLNNSGSNQETSLSLTATPTRFVSHANALCFSLHG